MFIKTRDGVTQPYLINPQNWPRLKEKYGDRIVQAPDQNKGVCADYVARKDNSRTV